jgi:predicted Fe-Mo cluster-binding NifX family protein
MNICVPILENQGFNSPVSSHFGKAAFFAIVDDETNTINCIPNTGQHHGGAVTPAQVLEQAGADVVLCGGLGVRAVRLFEQHRIHVYCDASGTVAEALAAYRAGTLPEATDANACQQHQH